MKKIKVNKDVCIGCGACQAICPNVYEIADDGLAQVKDEVKGLEELTEEDKDAAIDAKEGCPTAAIEIVEE